MIKETKVASCLKKSRSMQEWKCTQGVNLSVGYGEEHTEREYLDIDAFYQVTKLLEAIFSRQRELRNIVWQSMG